MQTPIRLLVIDEESRIRRGLVMRLATEPDLNVLGDAGESARACELALELRPDVVLMDLGTNHEGVFDAVAALRSAVPGTRIVLLSLRGDASTRERAHAAGAHAVVGATEGSEQLVAAIRAAARTQPPAGKETRS